MPYNPDWEENVSTKQLRIAKVARNHPETAILSLAHYIDKEWLYVAHDRTRKNGAVGVDHQTAEEYERNLDSNLTSLLDRFKSGTYRAPAVRRVYIPKGNGERRPLGIPTFEDKILQRAVLMVLNPVFEQDFYRFSYGFREGKNAHQALRELRTGLMKMKGGWVIDLDIRKYFDTIDHPMLRDIYKQRVSDGVIRRVLGKWLKAGILEDGTLRYAKKGAPQGGVISPLLSNIYLHEVLDKWFIEVVRPRLKGRAFMVRYADDAVLAFEAKEDAEKVMKVLPERFRKYNLELHEGKTKIISFESPSRDDDSDDDNSGSFDFLGFNLSWGKSRKGYDVILCQTAKDRVSRFLKGINYWIRWNRHRPITEQHNFLCRKLTGYFRYFGVPFNQRKLNHIGYEVRKLWLKWLRRRSRHHKLTWERFGRFLKNYPLPEPRIYHSLFGET